MKTGIALTLAGLILAAAPASAAVTDLAANGFEVEETVHIAAPPAAVYAMMLQPAKWWSATHTYSGSAANLSLDAKAGGCWCEQLADGGSAQHMRVVLVIPGKTIVLRGGLGPLMDQAIEGAMRWAVKPAGAETDFTMTYRIVGYVKDGFGALPKGVDGVLGAQAEGLKHAAETAK